MRVEESSAALCAMVDYLGFGSQVRANLTAVQNPLFIALDVEFNPKNITQLGISTFDPVSLADPNLSISNEYPILSTLYATKVSKFKERRRKPSHFGQYQVLKLNELRSLLRDILAPADIEGRSRDVILVGHMITSDIAEIKRSCGMDISELRSVKVIMDTQRISRHVLHPQHPLSLKDLLRTLGLEYIGLHNPSHDSRYTLRALLAMSVKYQQSNVSTEALTTSTKEKLELVDQVALFHQRRKPILWCEKSPRVRFSDNCDIMDQNDGSEFNIADALGGVFGNSHDHCSVQP